MKASIFQIERSGPGHLSTMARPRGGDWLADEMAALRDAGVNILVSMLTSSEVHELLLDNEEAKANIVGIEFVNLPTPDRGTPARADFRSLLTDLGGALSAGKHVAIHCRMGIGRSSLVAAGLLMDEGLSETDAWSAVAKARGVDVPDTPEQRAWLSTTLAFP